MIIDSIKKIDSLRQTLETYEPLQEEVTQKLDKKFRLEFHYNTNHLEGNTLTYSETELLLIFDETRGSHTGREYDEMRASDAALLLVEQLAKEKERPLSEVFIRQLNQILLVRPYWKEAITSEGIETQRLISIGEYKQQPNSVMLSNGEKFEYASPQETAILMGELIEWVQKELQSSKLHPVQLAAQLHYKFVRIHPFDDGNGRISRLLMNYVLFYFGFPSVVIKSDDKKKYLSALRDADTGNLESFEDYVANQLIWSFDTYIKAAKGESIEDKEDWKKKLQLLQAQLNNNEQIKKVKDIVTTEELIKDIIFPFVFKIKGELDNSFKDLFLTSEMAFKSSSDSANKVSTLDEALARFESYREKYTEHIIFLISYGDFTKNGTNTFDISTTIAFSFNKYDYVAAIGDDTILQKLYHLKLTEADNRDFLNNIGGNFVEAIERATNPL